MTWTVETIGLDGDPLAHVPARGLRYTTAVGQPGSLTFSMTAMEATGARGLHSVGGVDVLVTRDDEAMWRGPLEGCEDDVTPTSATTTFNAVGVAALLADRVVPAGTKWEAVEQAHILWGLIDLTQSKPGGDLRITTGPLPDTVARTRVFDTPTKVLQEMQGLSSLQDGVDWRIDPTLTGHTLQVWWQSGQQPPPKAAYELGRNIQALRVVVDASAARTAVTAVGRNQIGVTVENQDLIGAWRRREDTITTQDADDALFLGDTARGALQPPSRTVRLTLTPGAPDTRAGVVLPGDRVDVHAVTPRFTVTGTWAVEQIDVDVPNDGGPESLTVTLAGGVLE